MQTTLHKIGATFSMSASINTDITGWTITSQIRRLDGTLLDTLVYSLVEAGEELSTYNFKKVDTSTWPEGTYHCDIRYLESDGTISITETFEIKAVRSNTK